LTGRPLQFNLPIGTLLLNEDLYDYLKELINNYKRNSVNNKINNNNIILKDISFDLLNKILSNYPLSKEHFHYMAVTIMPSLHDELNNVDLEQKRTYTYHIICSQLSEILNKYLNFNNGEFDKVKYFKEVYSNNCDIYGILLCYITLLHLNGHKHFNSTKENKYINKIKKIIIKYCFSNNYNIQKIDNNTLIKELKNIIVDEKIKNKTYKIQKKIYKNNKIKHGKTIRK
jgi:hypothetical protein